MFKACLEIEEIVQRPTMKHNQMATCCELIINQVHSILLAEVTDQTTHSTLKALKH